MAAVVVEATVDAKTVEASLPNTAADEIAGSKT